VLERAEQEYEPDWIKSSNVGLVSRGLARFKELGLEDDFKSTAAEWDRRTVNLIDVKAS